MDQPFAVTQLVYRSVKPRHNIGGRPDAAAFWLRPTDGDCLSVWHAAIASPESLIQNAINEYLQKLDSHDKSIRKSGASWLFKYGSTVDEAVSNGWLVVALNVQQIIEFGFAIGDAQPDGHICIYGSESQFETMSEHLADACEIILSK